MTKKDPLYKHHYNDALHSTSPLENKDVPRTPTIDGELWLLDVAGNEWKFDVEKCYVWQQHFGGLGYGQMYERDRDTTSYWYEAAAPDFLATDTTFEVDGITFYRANLIATRLEWDE